MQRDDARHSRSVSWVRPKQTFVPPMSPWMLCWAATTRRPTMHKNTLKAFGFEREPFTKEFDDQDAWLPPSKQELVDAILQAIGARQHIMLVGEPGAGKTVVLRAVRHALPQTR